MRKDFNSPTRAIKIFFLVCGLALSGWAPMVPFAKERLQLDDKELGLLLLFLGAGAITAMPLTGWLIRRFGSKLVIVLSTLIIALTLPALTILDNWIAMAITLLVFGAGIGAIDVAMNSHGSVIQNSTKKHIMSSLHGLFSVGGLLGPLLIGALIKAGLSQLISAVSLSVLMIFLAATRGRSLLDKTEEEQLNAGHTVKKDEQTPGKTVWLNGTLIFLGAMCFIAFLSEGAMLDWSALLLHDNKGVDKALSGLGYACFSVAMAVMRLSGDKLISKFNSKSVVLIGSVIAFAGYGCILLIDWLPGTLFGFVLIGIGVANIVPIFFSAAGSMKNVPSASAVSMIGAIGYAGQLAGPAILGFLAQQLSLPMALFITGILFLIAGISFRMSKVEDSKR